MNKNEIVQHKTIVFHQEMIVALAKSNADTAHALYFDDSDTHALINHMAFGLFGEVAEVMENLVEAKGRENLVEELGDCEFYLGRLAQLVNYNSLMLIHGVTPNLGGTTALNATCYAVIKAGNIMDAVKRLTTYEKELNVEDLAKAITGMAYCLESIRVNSNITRQECFEHNINKLGKRYSGGTYSNKSAQERADKTKGE